MKNISLSISLLILLTFGYTYSQPQYPVYGKVISGLNGQPLQGIVVSLATDWDSVTTTTDVNGYYNLTVTDIENERTTVESSIEYLTSQTNASCNIRSREEDNAAVTIYDITGAEVQKYNYHLNYGVNEISLNTAALAQSVYLIKIETGEGSFMQKLIKSGNNSFWGSKPNTFRKNELNKKLNKTTSEGLRIYFKSNDEYYGYWDDDIINDWYQRDQGEYNVVLHNKGNIQNPFTSPTMPFPIKTNRDYIWFQNTVVDSLTIANHLPHYLPSKIFLDTANISVEWKNALRNKITEINARYIIPTLEETLEYLDEGHPGIIHMNYVSDTVTLPISNKVGAITWYLHANIARIGGARFWISLIKGLSTDDRTLQKTFDRLMQIYLLESIKINPDNRFFSSYSLLEKPLNGPNYPNADEIWLANFKILMSGQKKPGNIRYNNLKS